MKRIGIGAGFSVFVLFFGVALLDAMSSGNWMKLVFWVIIGIFFLAADNIQVWQRRKP